KERRCSIADRSDPDGGQWYFSPRRPIDIQPHASVLGAANGSGGRVRAVPGNIRCRTASFEGLSPSERPLQSNSHKLTAGSHAHLLKQLLQCSFHGALGHAEAGGNLFVGKPLKDPLQDVLFPLSQMLTPDLILSILDCCRHVLYDFLIHPNFSVSNGA